MTDLNQAAVNSLRLAERIVTMLQESEAGEDEQAAALYVALLLVRLEGVITDPLPASPSGPS